jgi:hypothetical protein
MSEETFAELMQSVAEGAKIFRGELPPASEFVIQSGTQAKDFVLLRDNTPRRGVIPA